MPASHQPVLESERVKVCPFVLEDASCIQALAGDLRVAKETMNIPYPYEDGMAEKWISSLEEKWLKRQRADFAVVEKETNDLIGSVGFVEVDDEEAELGYWIGFPYWGKGYCSEAANLVLEYGINSMSITKVTARHLSTNPGSGKVLIKLGMIRVKSEYRPDRYGKRVKFEFYETVRI